MSATTNETMVCEHVCVREGVHACMFVWELVCVSCVCICTYVGNSCMCVQDGAEFKMTGKLISQHGLC